MSKAIDQRIVEMQFNNRQFESGIKDSLSSLDKLKKGLKLDGAAKGLNSLADAGKKFTLAGISSGVDGIASKFSAMSVVGITALVNLTNQAVNAGKQIAAALTIDPIKTGYSEYELKMGSIQTIMAGTGEDLQTVNKYLQELNAYSDKTIYSFRDMTSNIGKFTNAGVSLKDSVAAIQGISNVAAVSGANAQEASRAMYNFSQAISSGYVKLIDWKSIELANMATKEFKTYLLDTAVAAGSLKKNSNGMYVTLKGNELNATKNFNDTLTDQWMTTEVLTKTLKMYSDETTDIGKKAFAAAQDIKTLSQMYDTLKEAAGSGWATTWELVFGNFEEGKKIFSEMGAFLSGLIGKSADARNEILQLWKNAGGRNDLIQSFRNAFAGLQSVITPITEALREFFPPITQKELIAFTYGLKNFTAKLKMGADTAKDVKRIFRGVFAVLDMGRDIVVTLAKHLKTFAESLIPGGKDLLSFAGDVGDWLVGLNQAADKTDYFNQKFTSMKDGIIAIAKGVKSALNTISIRIETVINNIQTAFYKFQTIDTSSVDLFVSDVRKKFKPFDGIAKVVETAMNLIGKVVEKVGPIFEKVKKFLVDTFGNLDFSKVAALFNAGIIGTIVLGLTKLIKSFTQITDGAGGFLKGITSVLDGVRGCLKAYQSDLRAKTLLTIASPIRILASTLFGLYLFDHK